MEPSGRRWDSGEGPFEFAEFEAHYGYPEALRRWAAAAPASSALLIRSSSGERVLNPTTGELARAPRVLCDIPEAVRRSVLEFSCPVATNDAFRNKSVSRLALVCKDWWEDVAEAGESSVLQRSVTITPSTATLFAAAVIPGLGQLCGEPRVARIQEGQRY